MELPFTHTRRNVLLIQKFSDVSEAFTVSPKSQNFLDHTIFFRVHDEPSIKSVVSIRKGWIPHLRRPRGV